MSREFLVVIVTGGRKYSDRPTVDRILGNIGAANILTLIHGAAGGADNLAHEWAEANQVETIPVPAWWKRYGNSAGPIRNKAMCRIAQAISQSYEIENPSILVVAFPGGRGTANMVETARRELCAEIMEVPNA